MKFRKARGLVAAVVLAVSVGVSPLVTTAVVGGQQNPVAQSKGQLRAGAARVDITPPVNPAYPPLNEYEHEKLYLRAIVFENKGVRGALIGADLGGIDEPVWADAAKRVAAELKTPVENVIISTTHTHSGQPAGPPSPTPAPRYGTEFLAKVALQAVKQAKTKLEPALVGYSTGEASLNVNRDVISPDTHKWTQAANLDAPVDRSVGVLTFYRPNGKPLATYVNYAMHPVNGYLNGLTSADFAGATSRYVEQAFGDDLVAVFTQGASGDVNPRWLRTGTNVLASRSGVPITGYEMVRETVEAPVRELKVPYGEVAPSVLRQLFNYLDAVGIVLGEEVIRVMSHTEDKVSDPAISGRQQLITCPGRTRLDNAREGVPGQYEDGPDVAIRIGALEIGDIALATTNAEIYTTIGLRVKKQSPLSKTMYVTLANGRAASGYIPDDESYGHQTFQVLGSRVKPGCAEDGIADGIRQLVSN
ncbi:neutral/alkaline non-lysosomal ceramidase N-terminal domain-containing protein [Kribbella catacumbae]|uniref:neutral/alkaline non-lysosomal ceramidase N-terminal domain-containing protein n=1 Tax=Kribbella catacumbae TaxID=460086 RepID=UPI00036E685E|nr:neutral/alkaline non-lysosomal ceramidase N-terminal domain-containing protein [Kribbella catacumbae]